MPSARRTRHAGATPRRGRTSSAVDAYQRAAWCYHLGKFLWFEDPSCTPNCAIVRLRCTQRTLAHLDPPAERIEIPFEDHIIPGHLRRPRGSRHAAARDHRSRARLLERGDVHHRERVPAPRHGDIEHRGPGSVGELGALRDRPNWETVITPVLDHLTALGLDQHFGLTGLMGISMGAIYGPRAAAHEPRLTAVIGLAGPYNLGDCWDALNPLHAAAMSSTRSRPARRRRDRRRSRSISKVCSTSHAAVARHPRSARSLVPTGAGGAHRP